ncbi:response regulator [bacterium]|nr:response regulator [bacterium]
MLKYENQSMIASTKKQILVVEDDIQMSKFIQLRLENMGYEVVGDAVNCTQALERSRKLKPDLIIMDIMLEGRDDGIDTAQKIIAQQQIPIIYLTAHEDEALFERAKITEPFGYLIKPFNDRDLRIVLETSFYHSAEELRVKQALQDVRNIINASVDIMITYDLEGNIIEFNAVAEQAFSLKRNLARKRSITTLLKTQADQTILLDGDPKAIIKHEQVNFIDGEGVAFSQGIVITPLLDTERKLLGRLLESRPD